MCEDDKTPEKYLITSMERKKAECKHQPEKFIKKEPGFYIGGVKFCPGDNDVIHHWGFPAINKAGCFE